MPRDERPLRRELLGQWLQKAEADFEAAEELLSSPRGLFYPVCFHCQQGAEKYLKGFLVYNGVDSPKTHDIQQILDLIEPIHPDLVRTVEDAIVLTPYAAQMRYPDDLAEPDEAETREAFALAVKVRDAVMRALR